jgi:hypothetical protein
MKESVCDRERVCERERERRRGGERESEAMGEKRPQQKRTSIQIISTGPFN